MAEKALCGWTACPKCGSDFWGGDLECDGNSTWKDYYCSDSRCGFEYREVFEFDHCETVDTCKHLDRNGDVMENENILLEPLTKNQK